MARLLPCIIMYSGVFATLNNHIFVLLAFSEILVSEMSNLTYFIQGFDRIVCRHYHVDAVRVKFLLLNDTLFRNPKLK